MKKSTIVLLITTVIIFMMMIISVSVMIQWRKNAEKTDKQDSLFNYIEPLDGVEETVNDQTGDISISNNTSTQLKPLSFFVKPTMPRLPRLFPSTPLISTNSVIADLYKTSNGLFSIGFKLDDINVRSYFDLDSIDLEVAGQNCKYTCGIHRSNTQEYNTNTYGAGYTCQPNDEGNKESKYVYNGDKSVKKTYYTCIDDMTTSSAPARMLQMDEFKLPFKHTDGSFRIVRKYYEKMCNQNDPPAPATIGFGVNAPFLNVFYNYFKTKNFVLYLYEPTNIIIFNPNLNYIRGLSKETKVITPWAIDLAYPSIRTVQIASLQCNNITVQFETPIVFQLSLSVLPAVTFSKNNIELVTFFNDVFYQETSNEQIELQFMFSNTTSTLTKVFDPITDFKKSNTQNILGINFFQKMTTCFNDNTQQTTIPNISFINF